MKILYLYAEVMGYTMATIRALAEQGGEVHVVHWDHKKLTPYQAPSLPKVHMYKRSETDVVAMNRLAEELSPEITVVSGWMDKSYMKVAKRLRARGKIVVMGLDNQWEGTLRQHVAAAMGRGRFFSRYYTHAWVPGPYQFEYARRLGFCKKRIIYDLYSADVDLFQRAYESGLQAKQQSYPRRFLFVGRFEPVKGLTTLLGGWQALGESKRDWKLHLIGNGSLKQALQAKPGLLIDDFMSAEQLLAEISHAGCFILPSFSEPWGVVVHEFAAAGLPLITSDEVGAASSFLIPGVNGYSFKTNNADELTRRMQQIIESTDQELMAMAKVSHQLSNRITPQTSAANLLSLTELVRI